MSTTAKGMLRSVATRSVIAAIPVAMVTAYAGNLFTPPGPRMAAYDYQPVAEITVGSGTVGVADSSLYFLTDPTLTIDPVAVAKHLDELQALGVDNIRVYVPWRFVEQQQGQYNWSSLNVIMDLAAQRNMGVLAAINSTPQWQDPNYQSYPGAAAPDLTSFKNFVSAFATKYGSTVSAYEIWNEPNYKAYLDPIDPAAYAQLLQAVYPVLKQIDPTATVVAAGLGAGYTVNGLTMNPVDFVTAMYAAGAKGYFDALAFHPYQETTKFSQGVYSGYPLNQAQALAALMVSKGDYVLGANGQPLLDAQGNPVTKKIWATEYGLPTSNVSYATQAAFIQDFLTTWAQQSWAGPTFLYTTVDSNPGSTNPEENYGLYTLDSNGNWVVKPAAQVVIDWILAHPGQTFDPTLPTTPTTPTTPTNPSNPLAGLAQLLQSFFQGIQNAISQFTSSFSQVFSAITQAIQNFFAAFSPPAAVTTTAAPLSLRVAAKSAVTTEPSAETAASTADTPAAVASTDATAKGVEASAPAKSIAEVVATPAAETSPAVVEAPPAVTEPVVVTTPTATETEVTPQAEPVSTKPAAADTSATTTTAANPADDAKSGDVSKGSDTSAAAKDSDGAGAEKSTSATNAKDTKDTKDTKDNKDNKDAKDSKDTKAVKEPKVKNEKDASPASSSHTGAGTGSASGGGSSSGSEG